MKETSRIANNMAKSTGLKDEHYFKILKGMKGRGAMNYHKIASYCGLHHSQVAKRLSEMVADGCILDAGSTSLTPSNRKATNYIINPKN